MSNESMASFITDTPSEISELLAENKLLKEELKREREGVDFYAKQTFNEKARSIINQRKIKSEDL